MSTLDPRSTRLCQSYIFTPAVSYMVRIDWLFQLTLLTFCNIICFSNVKSSRAESSEEVRTCTVYLLKGFSYKEIAMFLSNQHGIEIS